MHRNHFRCLKHIAVVPKHVTALYIYRGSLRCCGVSCARVCRVHVWRVCRCIRDLLHLASISTIVYRLNMSLHIGHCSVRDTRLWFRAVIPYGRDITFQAFFRRSLDRLVSMSLSVSLPLLLPKCFTASSVSLYVSLSPPLSVSISLLK